MRTSFFWLVGYFACCWPAVLQAQSPGTASASVPGAPRLLPEQTYAYVRIENVDELRGDLKESAIGQMLADPKLRPFASDVFVTVAQLFEEISGELGVTLDELLDIPHGQFAVGLIATGAADAGTSNASAGKDESPEAIRRRLQERREQQSGLGWLFVIETGENNQTLIKVLEDLEKRLARGGLVGRTESVGETKIRRLLRPDGSGSQMEYFHRSGATLIGIGPNVATDALARWNGKATGKTLAESTDFAAVMGRCIGAADTRPQVTLFADPYGLLKRAVPNSGVSAALGWAIAEELGIAKIRGVGASTFHGGEMFADIAHAHILIDPPRDGIFSVLRPKDGDTNPPTWVPDDVASYTSIGWRVDATYDGLGRILDRFQGENALQRLFEEPYKRRVGGDFRPSVIDQLDDRIVMVSWLQPPVQINSSVSIYGLKLKDVSVAATTLEDLQKAFPTAMQSESLGTTKLYLFGSNRQRATPEGLRRPEPCAAIVGEWLLTSDSRQFIERAIRAHGGALPRLAELPEYDLVASELGGQLGGDKPFLLSYTRTAEIFRQLYELARSDQTKSFLQTRGENNPRLRGFSDLLRRNELPPFDEFKKYFAPSGGFAYDEPSGIHFGSYTLKPE